MLSFAVRLRVTNEILSAGKLATTPFLRGMAGEAAAAQKEKVAPEKKEKAAADKKEKKVQPAGENKVKKEKKPRDPNAPVFRSGKKPWDENETIRLLRLAEMFEQWSITRDPTPFSFMKIPLVKTWKEVANYMPGRTPNECRAKFQKIEHEAFALGTSPFNYHPLSKFPSPPSPQQKRWLLSYIYNYLNMRGEIPDGKSVRRVQYPRLYSFLRTLDLNFYWREETLKKIILQDGAPFFSWDGDYLLLKDDISAEAIKQIRHLIFNREKLEKEINSAILNYLKDKDFVTLSEVKSHLLVFKRMSEAYFLIEGDLPDFLKNNLEARNLFAVAKNPNNEFDPIINLLTKRRYEASIDTTAEPVPAKLEEGAEKPAEAAAEEPKEEEEKKEN